jgi:outer membrane lipoprotein SlyB
MLRVISGAVVVGLLVLACGGGAGSPEAAVKGFFDAMKDGDIDKALTYMPSAEITDDTRAGLEMAAAFIDMMEIEVVGSEIDGDKATVTVKMTIMGEETEEEIPLVLEGGSWKLSQGF